MESTSSEGRGDQRRRRRSETWHAGGGAHESREHLRRVPPADRARHREALVPDRRDRAGRRGARAGSSCRSPTSSSRTSSSRSAAPGAAGGGSNRRRWSSPRCSGPGSSGRSSRATSASCTARRSPRPEPTGAGLRVTLSLTDAPELLQVPWEYLYDHPSFLSISTWTPIVRYLDLPKPRRPLQIAAAAPDPGARQRAVRRRVDRRRRGTGEARERARAAHRGGRDRHRLARGGQPPGPAAQAPQGRLSRLPLHRPRRLRPRGGRRRPAVRGRAGARADGSAATSSGRSSPTRCRFGWLSSIRAKALEARSRIRSRASRRA